MEAGGTGGPSVLIRTNSLFLGKAYQEGAPNIRTSVFAEDILENLMTLLNADTDYGAAWNPQDIEALDFAFVKKRYFYHTPYDTIDKITQGSIQHMGENVLMTTLQVNKNANMAHQKAKTRLVFQDFILGNTMLISTFTAFRALDIVIGIAILISFLIFGLIYFRKYGYEEEKKRIRTLYLVSLGFNVVSWFFGLIWSILLLVISDAIHPHTFYTNSTLCAALVFFSSSIKECI